MADIVHARDGLSASGVSAATKRKTAMGTFPAERQDKPPRTDIGTLTLHWATAIAFIVSLFTGIRIAGDALIAPVSHWLDPILPQGEIWTWHFLAGLTLFFCGSAYLIYMRRSGLANRNALKKTRVMVMPVASKMRFGGLNVLLHWAAYLIIAIMTVTGVLLYLGHGGWLVQVHSYTAFVGLTYIFVHVVAHYLFGGWWQVFRVFRPAKLVLTEAVKPKPLLIAALVGIGVTAAVAGIDWADRDTVTVTRVSSAPKVDGVLDDAAWGRVKPVRIETAQGVNLAGTGASTVWARAVHDGKKVYFAFQWTDPTRSMRRIPMIKREDGWHILHDGADIADVNTFYEDKFAALFANTPELGGAGSTAFGGKPLGDKPAPLHKRGYHYTMDGSVMDLWQWKASRGGHLGMVDDQYFGPPRDPTPAEAEGKARYQAGYWNDPGRAFYIYNYAGEPPGGFRGPVKVQRLPKDWKATNAALGKFDLKPDSVDEEGSKWWMTEAESVPYSKELDAQIPVGTVLPGVLIMGNYEGDRAEVRGAARWKDGMWTLETSRDLKTGSKFDKDFVPGRSLYMWVSVFDHTQTRHTRHHRPVRIVTQE
jgi:cytochrome b subunit of formate dehydrogenase